MRPGRGRRRRGRVCLCLCVCACMCQCVSVCVSACLSVCACVCVRVRLCVCVYATSSALCLLKQCCTVLLGDLCMSCGHVGRERVGSRCPSEACAVLLLSFAGYRAIVSASTLAQCIGIDSTASGGQAQNRALVEQYIASVEAATAKMNEFRSALEEREYVNKRAETAHLVEEATAAVGRLDQCHANIKELQVAFRQMQARCEDGRAPYSHSFGPCSQGTAPVCGPHHSSPPGVCVFVCVGMWSHHPCRDLCSFGVCVCVYVVSPPPNYHRHTQLPSTGWRVVGWARTLCPECMRQPQVSSALRTHTCQQRRYGPWYV